MHKSIAVLLMLGTTLLVGACATAPADLPYPAFEQAQELEQSFIAALPGSRAKQLFVNSRSGRASLLLLLPADWTWNSGGAPGKTVEIYVLDGEIALGDLTLQQGNYAYLPPGSMALPMSTSSGARVLYFLDDADPHAVIRTPLFMSRDVVPWQPFSSDPLDAGLQTKILRDDPGSGARTWLLKVAPGATGRWYKSPVWTEGYLLSGTYRHSECKNGEAVTGEYEAGGYFRRPAGVVSGGPESGSDTGAVWLIRQPARGARTYVDACPPAAKADESQASVR